MVPSVQTATPQQTLNNNNNTTTLTAASLIMSSSSSSSPLSLASQQQQQQQQHFALSPTNASFAANHSRRMKKEVDDQDDQDSVTWSVSSWSQRAMEWSQTASRHLRQDRLEESIHAYHQALEIYQHGRQQQQQQHRRRQGRRQGQEHDNGDTVVENKTSVLPAAAAAAAATVAAGNHNTTNIISLCNAGSCWRNLGAIHRKRKMYHAAIDSWKQAEELYRHTREQIMAKQRQQTKGTWTTTTSHDADVQQQHNEAPVSLDAYLVETLQSRAALHTRAREAIECHEETIEILMEHGNTTATWHVRITEALGTVVFGPMETEKWMEHVLLSLQSLATLYTSTGAYQDGWTAFQDALQHVRNLPEETLHSNNGNKHNSALSQQSYASRLSQIYQTVSELYMEKQDWDRAGNALQDALELIQQQSEEQQTSPDILLEAMDHMGQIHEKHGEYDKAMSLYEQVLLTRNQFLGDTHVHVAKSLIHVARVMELQGNDEGSLDIYRAAQAIYTRQVTSTEFRVAAEDVQSLLRLIPNVMEQGRYEEAVAYLNKCLESDNEELDKTQIYFDLGQAYIGMGDYVSATVCLVECAKQDGAVSDEQIDQLLDHVEYLKQQEQQQAAAVETYGRSSRANVRSSDDGESERDDSRSETENRSHSSLTERSPMPPDSSITPATDDEYDAYVEERVVDGKPYIMPSDEDDSGHRHYAKRKPLSPHKAGDPANLTPVTADFSRSASKSELPSMEGRIFWASYEDDMDVDAAADVNEKRSTLYVMTPNTRKTGPVVVSPASPTPSSAFNSSHHTETSSRIPSPVESLSQVEPLTEESDRQSPGGPSDEEPDMYPMDESDALVERQPEIELNESADTRALLEPSDGEDVEVPSPAKQYSKSRSRSTSSPRRRMVSSPRRRIESKNSDTNVKEKKNRFRRRRRQGFESLPADQKSRSPSPAVAAPLERDNEYHLDESSFVDAPVRIVEVEPGWDDISEISFNPHGRSTTWKRTNEWWWGVTAEGFGRWFPSSFVSQAVEVADGFLSAKAIHSRVKSAPLHVSEDESTDDRESQPTEEQASHLGVTGKKNPTFANGSTVGSRDYTEPVDAANGNFGVMMASSSPMRRRKRQDVLSDIRECSQQIAEQRMKLDENDPSLGDTLFRLALLHGQNQNIGSAMEAASSALRIQKLNSNFVVAARTLHFLAGLQLQERQYKSALTYYSEALRLETNLYGKYSEECAKTLNAIGTVRSLQDEFKLAMDSHKEALNVLKECHGEELHGNPLVSQTLCQIGAVYYRERNSITSIKANNGDYTTFIEAGMLEIIGRAHEERGSYKMAIAFFEEKLQFLENTTQNEVTQDELATTLNSLGMLSSRAGLFMEAVDYYDRALTLQLKIESDIVYMSTAKVLTATVQFQLGFWHKALQLLREALPVLESELGDKHETVAATFYHIGVTQAALCDYDAAMKSFSDAYEVQENLLGANHPASLRTRREIGNLYAVYKSELDYSFEIFTEVLGAQQQIHGAKHPNIAETLHSIGVAYAQKGADSTALKTLEECYYMRLEFLGVDHPLQATTLHEIAKIHMKKGRARKATSICETVLEIRKESLSEWHIDYARALATKGSSLSMRGEFEEATSCLNESLRAAKQSVFATHPAIGEIQLEMGMLWLRKCQFGEAKKSVEIAADIFRKANFDEDHPDLIKFADILDRIERDEALYV